MQAPVDSLNAAVAAALLLYSTRIARPGSDVSDPRVD
jgi:tRNA G18 (ribose-2'-O)-methylase SpoU